MTVTVPFFIPHLGCPHQCVFCNQHQIAGPGGGMPDKAEIHARIAAYARSGGVDSVQVAFFGGTFTALPRTAQEELLQPLQPLLASGAVESVRISTRPDYIDPATTLFLQRMGVRVVELGIQSMADDVLEKSGRGHTVSHVEQAAAILHKAGIVWGAQLMPGLPGDNPAKSMASLERVIELQPGFLRIYPTLVIRDTPLADLFLQRKYEPMTMDGTTELCMAMLHRAWRAGLPVIRMGLQPTDELEAPGTVLAGPYHPSLRYLVESELCFRLLLQLVKGMTRESSVRIACAPSRISTVIGHKRANVKRLEKQGGRIAAIEANSGYSSFDVSVEAGGVVRRGHLLHDLEAAQFSCFQ